MKKIFSMILICFLLSACQGQASLLLGSNIVLANTPVPEQNSPTSSPSQIPSRTPVPTSTPEPTTLNPQNSIVQSTLTPAPNRSGKVPKFDHIVLIMLENQSYGAVIGNSQMPILNSLAKKNVLLSNYYAVTHPSLPNYISVMSGDTQNITSDCINCFVNAPNIADLLEANGMTWKSYEESMPSPCYIGDKKLYAQKHNPLLYFDSIRLNPTRCTQSIVPLTQLDDDLAANQLPNFSFIMPNLCNSGHDCKLSVSDSWVGFMVTKLSASPAFGKNSLIVILYDEAEKSSKGTCCNLGSQAGGHVAALLISPLAKPGFVDSTAYDHYSVLKTILKAWNLPDLGKTNDPATFTILAPWLP
jgi:phosphatidylinositol-3-phosphatase